ncbi:CoA pyrophosphatase [Salinisphaera sp. Q1T1-3]|uniref:CoA pyrophosphatase n=1 Tax=Salinisphaera sp. Q1T1-3 TaxID=2321229 RepID=UPI000E72439A|nr:CoA pyrophosphatase [Salinisphaera sp. Q1T1-3]RJS95058.1 CoA pyrophosphatase [Salinisphaera sp. Q1T1-3]
MTRATETRAAQARDDWPTCLARACALPATLASPEDDARRDPSPGGRAAAVLIGIVDAPMPYIYFTERSATLTHHPGQISFPGGRIEATDASPAAAALREAWEEIGLVPERVRMLGQLPTYRTVTGFAITPCVGWIAPGRPCRPDDREVARVFGVPLAHAMEGANYRRHRHEHGGRRHRIYSLDHDANHIWGATAAMLCELARRVACVHDAPFVPVDVD